MKHYRSNFLRENRDIDASSSVSRPKRRVHRVQPPTPEQLVDWLVEESKKGAVSGGAFSHGSGGPSPITVHKQKVQEVKLIEGELVRIQKQEAAEEAKEAEKRGAKHVELVEKVNTLFRMCISFDIPPYMLYDILMERDLETDAAEYAKMYKLFPENS